MANGERFFVQAIRRYCAAHGIAIDVRLDGWLIAMRRGEIGRFAFGYDIGLNSAIAHRLANDKSATAEVLALAGVPSLPHHLFLNPKLGAHVAAPGWRDAILALLEQNPRGLVVKPNEGTSGRSVLKVTDPHGLERAIDQVFSSSPALVITPYVEIEQEVRVILLDESPLVVYVKERPSVVGDGIRTLRDLARAAAPGVRLDDLDRRDLDTIVTTGERRVLNWRHNLDAGATPSLVSHGYTRGLCAGLAIEAANAIGIRLAAIDVILVEGTWKVLEINSGVMMEALGKLHPELVQATYDAALDRMFGQPASWQVRTGR